MTSPSPANEVLVITAEDRYHRQQLIPWWNQERVARARVLVVGAGAIGNEILKLLALMGAGHILIYDMDTIEPSNLSRTVLFRETDGGALKAEVAAQRLRELNPDVTAFGQAQNIIHKAGWGAFLWADVVICGLDSRLARMFVNMACARLRYPWIDGAIEGLSGIVRVFDPARSACYECTMNEIDRQQVKERLSCAMLARDVASRGHVPTTAVAGSIIAAMEVQEAFKLLHGQPTLMSEGIHMNGLWGDFSRVRYPRRENCQGHDSFSRITPLGCGVADITLSELLDRAETSLGTGAQLELSRDVITHLDCPRCRTAEPCGRALGAVRESDARCPQCQAFRIVEFTGTISRDTDVDLSLTPAEIGVPPFDIIAPRQDSFATEGWLFDGDASEVLGPLASTFDPQQLADRLSPLN